MKLDEINALKEIASYDKRVKPTIYEADGCYFHGCVHIIKQRLMLLKVYSRCRSKEISQ